MGLLTSWGTFNKVTDTGLNVKYETENLEYEYSKEISSGMTYYYKKPYVQYRRFANKAYGYVGMDYSTAKGCFDTKLADYTRDYVRGVLSVDDMLPGWLPQFNNDRKIKACTSDVVLQHGAGDMWEVVINVNEEDVKVFGTALSSASAAFATENQRNYDEGGE